MFQLRKIKPLQKELKLFDVFAITTGATLSGGFFLLPGLAAAEAGTSILLSYLLVAIPLVPAVFSLVEMATAMPRAGGIYYFLDRSLGPQVGTIGGIGTWLVLILKSAFALIGMGAYIALFAKDFSIIPAAVAFAAVIGILNLISVKGSGKFQAALVIVLLLVLILFLAEGLPEVDLNKFRNILSGEAGTIFATTGLVYISYAGITKVISISEEVKDPERNLPFGIFLGLITAYIIYALGIFVMTGVVPGKELSGDLTPVATAARYIGGEIGAVLVSIAALVSFTSVANAGTLSASRYPFAMSRDFIFPHLFKRLNKKGIPFISVQLTAAAIILTIIFIDPTRIAKLASGFQLFLFALVCFSVIVMRESKLASYDPGYRSPLYPWMQIAGILTAFFLIFEMGVLTILFTSGLILIGIFWYGFYVKSKVRRSGAIYHVFERLGRMRYHGLDVELRGILKEKGLREDDPYEEILMRSLVIDFKEKAEFEQVVERVAVWLTNFTFFTKEEIKTRFLEGTRIGLTPVTHGIALPHIRLHGLEQAEMVLVRSNEGVHVIVNGPLTNFVDEEYFVKALFFLISPEDNPTQHLRILAKIAGRVEDDSFMEDWQRAFNEQELKETLLHDDRSISLIIKCGDASEEMIGKALREIRFPDGCLVALLHRGEQVIIPKGNFVFQEGDRLTIIGDAKSLIEINRTFGQSRAGK